MRLVHLAALAVIAALTAPAPSRTAAPAPTPTPTLPPSALAFDSDASLPAHADDVADYTLTATLDPAAHTIHGEGTIRWRNASRVSVTELWVHLYLNAFKNERSVYRREPIGGFRGTGLIADWGTIDVKKLALKDDAGAAVDLWPSAELHREGDEDETDARVPLPREVRPGETISLDVTWDDKLPTVIERTGFDGSFHFAGQWFPKLARLEPDGRWAHFPFYHLGEFYSDFGTYDVTLDVPSSFVIGATGPIVETRKTNGRRIERHVQSDVHDFAWTAWDAWQTESETIDGVAVTALYPPGFKVVAERELAAMRFALPHFREKYGRYPYSVLTLVHPPQSASEAGGMEYPTLITTGGAWYGPPGILAIELVTIHEFGHQYFYGMLASDEVKWPFLDEGINSYAEAEALEAWRGAGSVADLAGFTLSDHAVQAVFGNRAALAEPVAQPAYAFATGADYGALVYERTATILETMRRVYGDAEVARALGRYARRTRFLHPSPDDLFASFDDVLGAAPTETMRTALFAKGWVDYEVTSLSSQGSRGAAGIYDRDGKRETVGVGRPSEGAFEGWVLVTRKGTLTFPVDVDLTLADGSVQRLQWNGQGDATRLRYTGTVALSAAVVDPDHKVLLDDNLRNNHASVDQHGAPRTLERLTYWAELLLQAVCP